MSFIWYVILIVKGVLMIDAKWVIDVDSSILKEIKQNPTIGYLIKFHAPWCGHCRKFESAYEEIAKEVNDLSATIDELKDIRVVRIDATIYTDVANHFDIRGFPTIKFIRDTQIFPYENERTKSAVINFLKRVNGPTLRWITTIEQFDDLRKEHSVLFLIFTTYDDSDQLNKEYDDLINRYISQTYFYATNASVIYEKYLLQYEIDNNKSYLFAVKSDEFYLYKSGLYNDSLDEFIIKEKIATFPQISSGNIYELILTKKILVIYGFHEQATTAIGKEKRNELKSQIHNYILKHSSLVHEQFQFSWSYDLELLSNIAVSTVEEPILFLYDSVKRKYGIYSFVSTINNPLDIDSILNQIIANHSEIIQHTGDTWTKRLYRPFWELYRTILSLFTEAPILAMLIIGLPSSVLSIVCYCLCCLPNESSMNDMDMLDENQLSTNEITKTNLEKKDD